MISSIVHPYTVFHCIFLRLCRHGNGDHRDVTNNNPADEEDEEVEVKEDEEVDETHV